jgi:hypothetical protein
LPREHVIEDVVKHQFGQAAVFQKQLPWEHKHMQNANVALYLDKTTREIVWFRHVKGELVPLDAQESKIAKECIAATKPPQDIFAVTYDKPRYRKFSHSISRLS